MDFQGAYFILFVQNPQDESSLRRSLYITKKNVSVGQDDLIPLMQNKLCVYREQGYTFRKDATFEQLNSFLKELFPVLFSAIEGYNYLNGQISPWLVCSKQSGHSKGVIVFSDDSQLPTGMDIFAASQTGKARINFQEGILFLGLSFILTLF